MSKIEDALRVFRSMYEEMAAQSDLPSGSPLIDAAEAEIAALRAENARLLSDVEIKRAALALFAEWVNGYAVDLHDVKRAVEGALSNPPRATLRADNAKLREALEREREDFLVKALAWRNIYDKRDACPKCGGSGSIVYGSTATWMGGIGGQAMTNGVCDECWGSGDKRQKWADLRKMSAALRAKNTKLDEEVRILRLYGNKDCTAQADEALALSRKEEPNV